VRPFQLPENDFPGPGHSVLAVQRLVNLQLHISPLPVSRETAAVLGGACLGSAAPISAVDWPEQGILTPLLGSTAKRLHEIWTVDGECLGGSAQGMNWRRCGDLLFGVIEFSEADFSGMPVPPLQAASQAAYERIFALLDGQKLPYLWRVWNYLADINGEHDGLERYRQFNIGRQDAFLASQRGATGNVPAACALGFAAGPLSIAFLAGPTPAVPIENPRQVSAYDYPADYGPRSPTFSRAALVYPPAQEILFISGTASIVGHRTVHVGDVLGQCRESMANIAAVVDEANLSVRGPAFSLGQLAYRVYIRHAADYPRVRETLTPLLQGADNVVYVQADVCRSDLLVEIEAMALQTLDKP